ncbi:glycosyltransferase family 4 protein [Dietzia cinnamea]|nr:glycosyltransferase family 4 protein [Dietzia cinnamea]
MVAGAEESSDSDVEGFRLIRVAAPYANSMNFTRRLFAFLKYVVGATLASVRVDCDVVFGSSTPLTVAIPTLVTHWVRRRPMVFEVRDLWPEVPIQLGAIRNPTLIKVAQLLERQTYRSSACVVALSPWMGEGVKKVSSNTNTVIIPNACDFEHFEKSDSSKSAERRRLNWDDKFVVVYAGSFGRSYGLEWLVELAGRLADEVEFVMYGTGAAYDELHKLAQVRGLDPKRLLPGSLSKEEIASRLSAADMTISCLSEASVLQHNSLNKIFDSLAAGRPVLVNHGGWLAELVQENNAGVRLSRDIEEASKQIKEGIETWDVSSMGANAAKLGYENFDRNKMYGKFVATLEKAAKT